MSQTTFTVKIEIGGSPQTGLAVVMRDPTGAFGVKRNDTGAAVVAAGVAMAELGGGVYAYTFEDPGAELAYTGWVEYAHEGETYRLSHVFTSAAVEATDDGARRPWESIICYEDRAAFTTSRWRLTGVSTRIGASNTDGGLLWLRISRDGGMATCELHKDSRCMSLVASAAVDISMIDAEAVEVVLAPAGGSGLGGAFHLHACAADDVAPVQVALCVDEDLAALQEGIEHLDGYDPTAGLAEFVRIAGEDVAARVARLFVDQLGGRGTTDAWFLSDGERTWPDLRRIANPAQLRLATAYRALEIAIGRSHQRAGDSAYSVQRDRFAELFAEAIDSLSLSFINAGASPVQTAARRLART